MNPLGYLRVPPHVVTRGLEAVQGLYHTEGMLAV
jgi:hypothetical protein